MQKKEMKINPFKRDFWTSEDQISSLGAGEVGGKAKGLLFIDDVLLNSFPEGHYEGIDINIPKMVVLRTGIFDEFMKQNNLYQIAYSNLADDRIAHAFQKANLPFIKIGILLFTEKTYLCCTSKRLSFKSFDKGLYLNQQVITHNTAMAGNIYRIKL